VPTRAQIAAAARSSRRELAVAGIVFAWIALGAGTDSGAGIWRQRLVGVLTWTLLVALLRGEKRSVRLQVGTGGDPSSWPDAPRPTNIGVRPGVGVNGSDRPTT